jgi:hypothetical protein
MLEFLCNGFKSYWQHLYHVEKLNQHNIKMNTKNNFLLVNRTSVVCKKTMFGLVVLFLSVTASAQDDNKTRNDRISAGVKAGLNYANVWDEEGQDFRADPKFGLAGGVFVGIPLGKYIGVQPEILLSQKGFKGSGTLLGNGYSMTRTSTYLDVPLQVQIKPTSFLTLLVGPQYSYLLHQKDVYTLGQNSFEQEQEFKRDNIRKNILGFVIGADLNIDHLVLSARVSWDLQTNNGDGSSSTPRYKNQLVQFTIGYKI